MGNQGSQGRKSTRSSGARASQGKARSSAARALPTKPVQKTLQRQNSAGSKRDRKNRILSCGTDRVHFSEKEVVSVLVGVVNDRLRVNDLESALLSASERASRDLTSAGVLVLPFSGSSKAKITLASYVERIVHYLSGLAAWEKDHGKDPEIRSDLAVRYLIVALILLDRMQKRHDEVLITSQNVHRLLITGVLLAAKTSDDVQPKQRYFSDLGGISLKEMNALESNFLKLLNFEAYVSPEQFEEYYVQILDLAGEASNAENEVELPRKSSRMNLAQMAGGSRA